MVLCIEPQKIYSPGGCHEITFLSTFSHNGPRPTGSFNKCGSRAEETDQPFSIRGWAKLSCPKINSASPEF